MSHPLFRIIPNILVLAVVFCFFFLVETAQAATLSVSPGTGVYTAGQTFTARVLVNTTGASINAAEGVLSFNPAELSVVSVAKGSIFNLWTSDPSYSNSAGTVSFSGGTPSGYTGSAGTVVSVTFRTKNAGNPRVVFNSGAVLAADGRGTNVLTSMNGGNYTVAAQSTEPEAEVVYVPPANTPARPVISSTSHSDPDAWYTQKNATLSWSLPSGVTGVRTLLDKNSGSVPTKVYDSPIDSITLEDLDEGVQYFHLQFRNADGWGSVAHFRLAVDSKDPEGLTVTLPPEADLSNPVQSLLVELDDDGSAVERFLISVDGAEPYEYIDEHGSSTIVLSTLEPGHHTIVIEAFDKAGNSAVDTLSFGILAFDRPQFTEYPAEVSESVIPVIKGITRPRSEVTVYFTKVGADTQEVSLVSDEGGEFVFIPESRLSLGVYELSAVATDQHGAQSEMSDVVRIAVQQPGYIRVGSVALDVLSVFVPLLALVLLSILGLFFLLARMRSLRGGVAKESKEALSILHAEFAALRKIINEETTTLAESRKTKKLTKAEAALMEHMESALAASEEKVSKEIEDVEKIVE